MCDKQLVNMERKIKKLVRKHSFAIGLVLLALGLVAVATSFVVSYLTGDGGWFQRSGSVIVLLSVFLEICYSILKEPIPSNTVFIEKKPAVTHPKLKSVDSIFHGLAWLGILGGTLIWGYGDLLFSSLICNIHSPEVSIFYARLPWVTTNMW